MNTPSVTVLMSVFNGEKFLKEAIESILKQTFKDFVFLIIDDASTDRSVEIIRSYSDFRIQLIQNKNNLGLAASLNLGLAECKTPYVARMDADDISLPHRLKVQYEWMQKHPEVGVCGTFMKELNGKKYFKHGGKRQSCH
jgi:glycosyltransferase involved in cell wall biosynthesis